jgi:hypothetical protein
MLTPSNAIEAAAQCTAFSSSFILYNGEPPPFWPSAIHDSFIVFAPPRPKRRRKPRAKPDAWLKLAGYLELAADLGRQCARSARSRDPAALDAAMDRWREAVLDAIALCNTAVLS